MDGQENSDCPSEFVLVQFLAGKLMQTAFETVLAHVERCEACQLSLEACDRAVDAELLELLTVGEETPGLPEEQMRALHERLNGVLVDERQFPSLFAGSGNHASPSPQRTEDSLPPTPSPSERYQRMRELGSETGSADGLPSPTDPPRTHAVRDEDSPENQTLVSPRPHSRRFLRSVLPLLLMIVATALLAIWFWLG